MENEEKETRPRFDRWLGLHVAPAIFLLIVGAGVIIKVATALRSDPETQEPQKIVPVVEVIQARPQETQSIIESQGTVQARTETTLLAEVSGRVTSVSPALYAGGFFKKGDILATIDDTDYVAALASAKSKYADARVAYEQELALADQAQEDWRSMGSESAPSELVLRKPQLARAEASLEAAKAAVAMAERDLERTAVKAPYDGRAHNKFIDIGQFVNARTSQIASIYAIDTAEVRLAIPLDDTRLIHIPETFSDGSTSGQKPRVIVTARYGGKDYHWKGVIDRSEGTVDPQTRLLYLVAQIDDPYSKDGENNRPPLKIGSYVTAMIIGQKLDNAYVLPRRALREGDTLYIIKENRTLEVRSVQTFQKTSERVIVNEGLSEGEMVCLTPLQYVIEGMDVIVEGDETDSEEETTPSREPNEALADA